MSASGGTLLSRTRRNLCSPGLGLLNMSVYTYASPLPCFIVACHVLAGVSFAWRPARNAPCGDSGVVSHVHSSEWEGRLSTGVSQTMLTLYLLNVFHANPMTPSKIALEPPRAAIMSAMLSLLWVAAKKKLSRSCHTIVFLAIRKNGVRILVTNFQPRPLRRARRWIV